MWRVEISATYPPPLLTFVYGEIAMFPFTLYLFAILLLSASVLRSRSRPRKDRIRNTAVVSQVGPLTMFSSVDIKHGNIGTICKQYHFTVLQNIFGIKKDRTRVHRPTLPVLRKYTGIPIQLFQCLLKGAVSRDLYPPIFLPI